MDSRSFAGSGIQGNYQYPELFAGERPVTTDEGLFATGQLIARYTVIAKRASDSKIVPFDPTSSDAGTKLVLGITCYDIDTTTVPGDATGAFYDDGCFNHAALVWPASVNTLELRKQAFARTPAQIKSIF